jgi:hypothetical protein
MTWIENTVIHFQKGNAQKDIQQTPPKEVDQAAVEKATMIWWNPSSIPTRK